MRIHALFEMERPDIDARTAPSWPTDSPSSLTSLIDRAAMLLPSQGPINVFVSQNSLQAFENRSFDDGVRRGAEIFGCQPYLSEERFREHLAQGRIRLADLHSVLHGDLDDHGQKLVFQSCTRFQLRAAMLQFAIWTAPQAELRWFIAQTDALKTFRSEIAPAYRRRFLVETRHWAMRDLQSIDDNQTSHPLHSSLASMLETFDARTPEEWSETTWEAFTLQALWRVVRDAVSRVPPADPVIPDIIRPRDRLLAATSRDADEPVNELLIRFCGAFLDQGISHCPMPSRDQGFLRSFAEMYRLPLGSHDRWLRGLKSELDHLAEIHFDPLKSIRKSLDALGVSPDRWDDAIAASLLSLRGWAGMIRQMETRADRVAHPVPEGSLREYLAVRLILERLSAAHIAREELDYHGPLADLSNVLASPQPVPTITPDQRAFMVFQLAQILGWSPPELWLVADHDWRRLIHEVEAFPNLQRRRLFQQAFERCYRNQALDAIIANSSRPGNLGKPRFQMVCCLDDREESFRRHVEEIEPNAETFGIAGFFNVAMYFRGAADAHAVPLCPIVIRPDHWVEEVVVDSLEESHQKRARARRTLGQAAHQFHRGSRSGAIGALLTACVGALATIPLVMRVLFPRLTSRIRRSAGRFLRAPDVTQLRLEHIESANTIPSDRRGFTLDEMANIAERLLRDIGLIDRFADFVVLLGHGSTSVNNPHKSAYDCGACGGGAGGANARAAAQMLNDSRVRAKLADRGLAIPENTRFVGGIHNTCNEAVTYFDLQQLPPDRRAQFDVIAAAIDQACDRNAHERARRFRSAPLTLSFAVARRHVEARSEDLAQTRPECGHASNAVCFVGRRHRTRGLFMDRRAFLASYDPTRDDLERTILTRILRAAVPVCGGINLQYYFSFVDSPGWGCGTKLPHNVTGLLGVMDGAASDLRTGLPWQGVEIHEPLRLLFVIESTPAIMTRILRDNPEIRQPIANGWVQLSVIDPSSDAVFLYDAGEFLPYHPENTLLPRMASSAEWYRGWRDHLPFAVLQNQR